MQKPKIIAVVGPTASGKTSLGIFLAQKLGGEVISADSRQVYRGLDIGTGKVTKKEMAGIPHHLLDVAHPTRQFSASDFVTKAAKAIGLVHQVGHIPFVVGGTGFYVDTLLGRMHFPEVPPQEKLRAKLEKKPLETLLEMLETKDPARAATIERGNKRRVIRALEIAHVLGTSPAGGPDLTASGPYDVLWLGVQLPEEKLHANIRTRLLARIEEGMVAEAIALHNPPKGRGLSYKRMEALGLEYRYLSQLLQHKISKEDFVEQLERAIRQYAKRQMRWFKRNKDIHWVSSKTEALQLAKEFLS